jgi:hypothetical protein
VCFLGLVNGSSSRSEEGREKVRWSVYSKLFVATWAECFPLIKAFGRQCSPSRELDLHGVLLPAPSWLPRVRECYCLCFSPGCLYFLSLVSTNPAHNLVNGPFI